MFTAPDGSGSSGGSGGSFGSSSDGRPGKSCCVGRVDGISDLEGPGAEKSKAEPKRGPGKSVLMGEGEGASAACVFFPLTV